MVETNLSNLSQKVSRELKALNEKVAKLNKLTMMAVTENVPGPMPPPQRPRSRVQRS